MQCNHQVDDDAIMMIQSDLQPDAIMRSLGSEFRIMQWNMLARALWPYDPTSVNPKETFDWVNFRLWRSLQELVRYDSDIICVEEADFYEEIKPYMHSLGYTSIFSPKFSSPCLDFANNIGPDGPAIFFRKSMFQIVNMTCGEKLIINSEINPQVFIIAQLKHAPTGKSVYVVCLHLKSKAGNFARREAQIKIILDSIKVHLKGSSWMPKPEWTTELRSEPLIICGDFNGEPFEKFYDLIVRDGTLNLIDAYTPTDGSPKQATTIKYRNNEMISRAIDYIFFDPNAFKVCGLLDLPQNDKTISEVGLPNLSYSSDHLSLVCDFKFA
jgi:nocturnin